jgi:hypothetical protein
MEDFDEIENTNDELENNNNNNNNNNDNDLLTEPYPPNFYNFVENEPLGDTLEEKQ